MVNFTPAQCTNVETVVVPRPCSELNKPTMNIAHKRNNKQLDDSFPTQQMLTAVHFHLFLNG